MSCAFMFGIPRAFCKCVGGRPQKHGIQAALELVLQCDWPCPYRDAVTIDVMPKMVLVLLVRPRFHHCHLHKTHNWFPHRHSQSLNHQFVDCSRRLHWSRPSFSSVLYLHRHKDILSTDDPLVDESYGILLHILDKYNHYCLSVRPYGSCNTRKIFN